MTEILINHWHPMSEALNAAFPAIQTNALASFAIADAVYPYIVEMECFEANTSVIACLSAKPHLDDQSPKYTALWIVKADGHLIGVSATRPSDIYRGTHPRPAKRAEYKAVVCEIALLDTQSLHWLLPGCGVFAAIGAEWDQIPSRHEVEARFMELMQ
jgi:hypothetical protein